MSADPAMLAFYDRKTDYWIEKFGPGPRVHYHTGLVEPGEAAAPTMDGLKDQLVRSQERMLERAASVWGGRAAFGGELVDIGCGLGGSAIWFAQRFGARVTGITPIEVVEQDVTAEAAGFWRLNIDYSRRRLVGEALSTAQAAERERSIEWLSIFERGHHEGGFVDAILGWRRD